MATALDTIKRSMRLLGVLAKAEVPDAQEAQDGLAALNTMLDSWWNERLAVYRLLEENFALTPGTGSYTIGPSGAFNTTRPLRIVTAFVRYQNIDYPLDVIANDDYDAIVIKGNSVQSFPSCLFYDPAFPLATIFLSPVPHAAMNLYINTPQRLQSFSNLTDTVTLPPGYQRALDYNFAVEYAPEFGIAASPAILAIARESKAILKRLNTNQPTISVDPMWLSGTGFNYEIPAT